MSSNRRSKVKKIKNKTTLIYSITYLQSEGGRGMGGVIKFYIMDCVKLTTKNIVLLNIVYT